MCNTRKVKQLGRCKICQATRCISCGEALAQFVRMIETTKFRKKQWENKLYDHQTLIKTHTYETICVNPNCPKHFDPAKLKENWQEVKPKPVLEKPKSFEEAMAEVEQIVQEQT
jgi:hypothetical protein